MSRTIALAALLTAFTESSAQCWDEGSESLNGVADSVIRLEAMSLIDWIWEYDGKGVKPDLVHINGDHNCREHANFKGHGMEVQLGAIPFDTGAHDLGYDERSGYRFLCTIDGRPFRGTDGDAPRTALSEPLVVFDGKKIQIPDTAWRDLYEPNFCYFPKVGGIDWYCGVARSPDRRRTYIHMMNSDGAGSYEVIWIFVDGRYLRRVLEGPP